MEFYIKKLIKKVEKINFLFKSIQKTNWFVLSCRKLFENIKFYINSEILVYFVVAKITKKLARKIYTWFYGLSKTNHGMFKVDLCIYFYFVILLVYLWSLSK